MVKIFNPNEENEILNYFNENGYVCVRVLSNQECIDTFTDVGAQMTSLNSGFNIMDPETYGNAPISGNYGLYSGTPIFTRKFLENRQNQNIYNVYKLLYGDDNLIVNHDRCAFYRATTQHPEWKTAYTYPNLHLDFNPGVYHNSNIVRNSRESLTYSDLRDFISENNHYCEDDGLQIQGVLNICNNRDEDGGFQCVPGFPLKFNDWMKEYSDSDKSPSGKYEFSTLSKNDMKYVSNPLRIPVPSGTLILWNKKMAHGSVPNDSDRARCIQFINMYPKKIISKKRLELRKKALQKIFNDTGFTPSNVGKIVFDI